jgi:hypothetical protein
MMRSIVVDRTDGHIAVVVVLSRSVLWHKIVLILRKQRIMVSHIFIFLRLYLPL